MVAEWREVDVLSIFPDYLEDAIDGLTAVIGGVQTAVDGLATVAAVAALLAETYKDAQAAAVIAAQSLLDGLLQQLQTTGVYWTWHIPVSFTATLSPTQWCSDVANSFDDLYDDERPMMPTSAFVGVVAIVATSDSYSALLTALEKLFELLQKFIDPDYPKEPWPDLVDSFEVRPGEGKAPNWSNVTMLDVIPPMGQLVDKLSELSELLNTAQDNPLNDFADFLDAKSDVLDEIASTLTTILNSLRELFDMDGLYLFTVYGEYTGEELQAAFRNTPGGPKEVAGADFTGGVVFLTTGGTTAKTQREEADALMALFGYLPEDFEEAVE